mmetsp:Transcript_18084/g.57790  ORF Transcript_18084/g.57790 Transcript_18084/m.57790 type:complete len:123 (-) Transcript_18084:198-566(-)
MAKVEWPAFHTLVWPEDVREQLTSDELDNRRDRVLVASQEESDGSLDCGSRDALACLSLNVAKEDLAKPTTTFTRFEEREQHYFVALRFIRHRVEERAKAAEELLKRGRIALAPQCDRETKM